MSDDDRPQPQRIECRRSLRSSRRNDHRRSSRSTQTGSSRDGVEEEGAMACQTTIAAPPSVEIRHRPRSPLHRPTSPLQPPRSHLNRSRSPQNRSRSPLTRERSPINRPPSPLIRSRSHSNSSRSPQLPPRSLQSILESTSRDHESSDEYPGSEDDYPSTNDYFDSSDNDFFDDDFEFSSDEGTFSDNVPPAQFVDGLMSCLRQFASGLQHRGDDVTVDCVGDIDVDGSICVNYIDATNDVSDAALDITITHLVDQAKVAEGHNVDVTVLPASLGQVMIQVSRRPDRLSGRVDDLEQVNLGGGDPEHTQTTSSLTCAVCIEDLEAGETIRRLPCSHLGHRACLVAWFWRHNRTCPICRADVLEGLDGEAEASPAITRSPRSTNPRTTSPPNPINQSSCDVMWTDSPSPPSPHHHTHTCPPTTTHLSPHHHTSVPPPPHSSPTPPPSDCFAAVSGHFPRGSEMGMSFFTMLPHVKGDNGMQRLHVIALLK